MAVHDQSASAATPGHEESVYLSDLLGNTVVDGQGRRIGRLRDVSARITSAGRPPVVGLLIRRRGMDLILAADDVAYPAHGILSVGMGSSPPTAVARQAHEVLLGRDIVDSQVIDLHGHRIVRVNDVLLERSGEAWHVTGIDIGIRALLRRLLPRALRRRHGGEHVLTWADIEIFASEVPGGKIVPDHRRLARLHPADIARVADQAPSRQTTEIVASLDLDLAADTMEEMIDEKQANVVEALPPERAAHVLERMAPDAAADVLAHLQPGLVDSTLRLMSPAEAADIHALLTYPKDTAGGLMTTDYVIVPRELRVSEMLSYLKPQLERPDWVYYVYVVEEVHERLLLGVLSLRDLLLADPERRVDEIMVRVPRQVEPDATAATVARIMSEYNLMALPVVDGKGRLLGIVSVDDALEVILPAALRRRVPRVFS